MLTTGTAQSVRVAERALNRMIDALEAADTPALQSVFADDVKLRASLPRSDVERTGRADAAALMVGWFADATDITRVHLRREANRHPDRAMEGYRHVLRRCQETEERHYCVPVLQFAVACFAAGGADADLGAATALLADAAARTGQPEAGAVFAYALGESAFATGGSGDAAAVAHLRRAIELLDGMHLPIVDVVVRHRLGAALAGSDEGRNAVREAYSTARRLRARLLVDRISVDLNGSPAAVENLLTERELQVMRLVGEGLTSRAIGSQLFLSVRTVEMHARNAMAKLGCRTRAEAARRLATP